MNNKKLFSLFFFLIIFVASYFFLKGTPLEKNASLNDEATVAPETVVPPSKIELEKTGITEKKILFPFQFKSMASVKNLDSIKKAFKDRYPDKSFKFKRSFDTYFEKLSGDSLDNYKNLSLEKAVHSFMLDNKELFSETLEGIEYNIKKTVETDRQLIAVVSGSYKGLDFPFEYALFFENNKGLTGDFKELSNHSALLKKIDSCQDYNHLDGLNLCKKNFKPMNGECDFEKTRYFPTSGMTAKLGHVYHYKKRMQGKIVVYQVTIDACTGKIFRLPSIISQD